MDTSLGETNMVTQAEDARIVSSAYGPIQQSWRKRYAEAIADFLALGSAIWIASQLVSLSTGEPHDLRGFAYPALLAALLIPFMGISGLYANLELSLASRVRRMFLAQVLVLLAGVPLLAIWGGRADVTLVFAVSVAVFLPLSIAVKESVILAKKRHRSSPQNLCHVLVVGGDEGSRDLIALLRSGERHSCRIVGCLQTSGIESGNSVGGVPILGTAAELQTVLSHNAVDLVIVAGAGASPEEIPGWADSVLQLGLAFGVVGSFCDVDRLRFQPARTGSSLLGVHMQLLSGVDQSRRYLLIKRCFDFTVAALALLVLSPFLLTIALLVKVTSPHGPIFYPWAVLGKNRRPFLGYKFRTMVPNADALKESLLAFNEMNGAAFKMRNDPRITPLGRILRKFSLDELPQLYSVLKGDMSLVGPRPPSKSEADRFEYWQHRKLCVKPGITCLWQISGRSNIVSFSEWVRLDLEYIRTASIRTDLRILFRTIPVVLKGTGAC